MKLVVDLTDPAAPRTFAAALADLPLDGPVTVRLAGDEVCPSRIVPIVGLADAWLRRGGKLAFEMACDEAVSLEQVFGDGRPQVDLWQEARETADGAVCLAVGELVESLGTRDSAERLRHVAENAIDNDGRRIQLDFSGVESCSSAFADEQIGKLVARYGFVGFMDRVSLRHLGGLAAMLVNSTLAQRMANEGRSAT